MTFLTLTDDQWIDFQEFTYREQIL
jgi:hypothetical protein